MISQSEIATATVRLTANKIKPDDRESLLAVYKIYLKNRFSIFPDLAARLAAAEDNAEGKTASKLVAILIQLEESGFDLSELRGGRSGLQTNEIGSLNFKIKFGLVLLGYALPEEFTGSIENADETMLANNFFFPSVTIDRKATW